MSFERTTIVTAMLSTVSLLAQSGPPQLLQVVREPVKVGNEAAYTEIENETARACVELKCPHPHLALEPVVGPMEVWWFNLFASEADRQRVTDAYSRNRPLMAVLERNNRRKASHTGTPVDLLLTYRRDLSRGATWGPAGARFVVATITTGSVQRQGSVFDAPDGTRYILRSAKTRDEADALAFGAGGETTVLAVRPSWGLPAKDWIDADPDFWAPNPMLQR
jgi:hypothetical protein